MKTGGVLEVGSVATFEGGIVSGRGLCSWGAGNALCLDVGGGITSNHFVVSHQAVCFFFFCTLLYIVMFQCQNYLKQNKTHRS